MGNPKPVVITIDGPAGSGKSTVARMLAKELGLRFLDTGAMYRGLTAYCLDHAINPAAQPQAVIDAAHNIQMQFDWTTDPPHFLIDNQDVTSRLRDPDVTRHVSDVAVIPQVRQVMVDAQRCMAHETSPPKPAPNKISQPISQAHSQPPVIYGVVSEGRDQGSVAFPKADAKFYLKADLSVRARRRADELRTAGKTITDAEVVEAIRQRDHRDTHRTDGPLVRPSDAQVIDTSHMTIQQVVEDLKLRVQPLFDDAFRIEPENLAPTEPMQKTQPKPNIVITSSGSSGPAPPPTPGVGPGQSKL